MSLTAAPAPRTAASPMDSGVPAIVTTARLWSASISWASRYTPLTEVMAFTIASTTSGRRPSLKLGTHSTNRFIGTPDKFAALECRDTKVYRGEIGNLTVIRNLIDGKVRLFSRFNRTQAGLAADGARAVDGGRR